MIAPQWVIGSGYSDVVPFIEAFRKMAGQHYPDKIDVYKDAVSIPSTSMIYVLNKSLEKKIKGLNYIHQGTSVTYVEIYEKNSSTVVIMVP